ARARDPVCSTAGVSRRDHTGGARGARRARLWRRTGTHVRPRMARRAPPAKALSAIARRLIRNGAAMAVVPAIHTVSNGRGRAVFSLWLPLLRRLDSLQDSLPPRSRPVEAMPPNPIQALHGLRP